MTTYSNGPMDFAKMLKLRFRVGNLDLSEARKMFTRSWEEEEVDAHIDVSVWQINSRTHIVGEREIRKEERNVL